MSDLEGEVGKYTTSIVIVIAVIAVFAFIVRRLISFCRGFTVFNLPESHVVVRLWTYRFNTLHYRFHQTSEARIDEFKSDWMLEIFCEIQLLIGVEDFPWIILSRLLRHFVSSDHMVESKVQEVE